MSVPVETIMSIYNLRTGYAEWLPPGPSGSAFFKAGGDPRLAASGSASSKAGGDPRQKSILPTPSGSTSSKAGGDPRRKNKNKIPDVLDEFEECIHCKAVLAAGTQFYDQCSSATTSKILDPETRKEGQDKAVKTLFDSINLQRAPRDRRNRGGKSLAPAQVFKQKCKELHKRALKGVRSNRMTYTGIADRFRRDEICAGRVREEVPGMDEAMAAEMDELAIETIAQPIQEVSYYGRQQRCGNYTHIRSSQAGGSECLSVAAHPDFAATRAPRGAAAGSDHKGKGSSSASSSSQRPAPYRRWTDQEWQD